MCQLRRHEVVTAEDKKEAIAPNAFQARDISSNAVYALNLAHADSQPPVLKMTNADYAQGQEHFRYVIALADR